MSPLCRRAAVLVFTLSVTSPVLLSQTGAESGVQAGARTDTPPNSGQLTPGDYRWNAELDVTAVHTSTTGWATLAMPTFGWRFNEVFSLDATLPVYFYRLAESRSTRPRPGAALVIQRGEVGDFVLSTHAQFVPRPANYELTAAVTAPSGDEAYGLTTGRVTFDFSNQFDRSFGRFTPTLEVGGGDSSTLVNRLVTKTYTSLGPLAHFQAGLSTLLTSRNSLEMDAYEQLPLGDQKIYTSKLRRKKLTTVVTGRNVSEDNGFNAAFEHAVEGHTTFTSYYSRSLRLHTDTVSVGIAYLLRGSAPAEDQPIDTFFH